MVQRAILGRPPCEFDLSLFDRHQLPLTREFEIGTIEPPHVIAAGVDELELKVIHGRIGAHIERDFVVRRQVEWQSTAGDCITGGSAEVEVQSEGAAVGPIGGIDRCVNVVGRHRLPCCYLIEAIQHARRWQFGGPRPDREAAGNDGETDPGSRRHCAVVAPALALFDGARHPLTLPPIKP